MLRVALAGAGMVSRHHLTAWSRCRDAQIVAIADPDREKAQERAKEFGIPAIFDDAAQMLDAERPDALDIAAPMNIHGDLIGLADRSGVSAVLCQKPLASTFSEGQAIVQRLETSKLRVMVHENWRFRPHYQRIAEWLQEGRIGKARSFHMETLSASMLSDESDAPPGLLRQPFLASMERLIVLELLIHHLDTLQFLLGPMTVQDSYTARLSRNVRGEDTALILLDSRNIFGTLRGSMAAHGCPPRPLDRLDIQGDEGRILLENETLTCFGSTPESALIDHETDYQASYDNAISHFVEAIRTKTEFATKPEAHLAILKQIESVYSVA